MSRHDHVEGASIRRTLEAPKRIWRCETGAPGWRWWRDSASPDEMRTAGINPDGLPLVEYVRADLVREVSE